MKAEARTRASVMHSVGGAVQVWANLRGLVVPEMPIPLSTDIYEWIPLRGYLTYLEQCADCLQEPLLGLEICSTFQPNELGPIGFLFAAAHRVEDACMHLCAFLNAWQEDTDVLWVRGDRYCSWSYRINSTHLHGLRRQDALFTMGVMVRWLQLKLGTRWHPVEVHFEHFESDHASSIKAFFGCEVYFGQETNRVVVDIEDAENRSSESRMADFLPFIERHLNDLLHESRTSDDLVERARREVARSIGVRSVQIGSLAVILGVSKRTLQRKLAAMDTSLRQILKEEREKIVRELEEAGPMPIGQLAQRLGYTDTSSTCRAVKAWRAAV